MTNKAQPTYSLEQNLALGQNVEYKDHYAPELLQGVPRSLSRDLINISEPLPFTGIDIWNGYELSWLNEKGKPQVAILRCWVPITSEFLVESKSFKLYLNSFNQSKFSSWEDVKLALEKDLSACAGQTVEVALLSLQDFASTSLGKPDGILIDDLDIDVDTYSPDTSLLSTSSEWVSETLCSDLLKSNCLITSQPDWASIMVRYEGNKIDHADLLKYFISFRQHNEFHEQCVERIFCDILSTCNPEKLTVYARYTRRGGLDINPFRSNFEQPGADVRLPRQ
jgi:7-cyano-7-deazaguanine reductase